MTFKVTLTKLLSLNAFIRFPKNKNNKDSPTGPALI